MLKYLNLCVMLWPVDAAISAALPGSQAVVQQHAKQLRIQEAAKDHMSVSSESAQIWRVDLEHPSNFNELGVAFAQCYDLTGLKIHASKAADLELRRN